MSTTKNLYQRIHAVMNEIGTIAKTGRNSFHNYNYAKESDYVESLRPLLIKHGIVIVPELGNIPKREGDITELIMKFHLINMDNPEERTTAVVPAAGQDKGDKGVYKAITGAKKYFLANTFLIATGDDPEKDDERTPVKPKNKGPTKPVNDF